MDNTLDSNNWEFLRQVNHNDCLDYPIIFNFLSKLDDNDPCPIIFKHDDNIGIWLSPRYPIWFNKKRLLPKKIVIQIVSEWKRSLLTLK